MTFYIFCPIVNPSKVEVDVAIKPNVSLFDAVVVNVGVVPFTQRIVENHVTVPDPPLFCVTETTNTCPEVTLDKAKVTESEADEPEKVKF
jgi:hypothetical protein